MNNYEPKPRISVIDTDRALQQEINDLEDEELRKILKNVWALPTIIALGSLIPKPVQGAADDN